MRGKPLIFLWLWSKYGNIGDNKGVSAVVLTDLSKALDCIPHGLLIAKLNPFGFDKKSMYFISIKENNKPK